jgi:hypothetical protein
LAGDTVKVGAILAMGSLLYNGTRAMLGMSDAAGHPTNR